MKMWAGIVMVMWHHKFCSRCSTVSGAARCPLGGATGGVQGGPFWLADWPTGCIWTPVHFLPEPIIITECSEVLLENPHGSSVKKKPSILRSKDVCYCIRNSPPLVSILSQINPRPPIVFINIHKCFFPSGIPTRILYVFYFFVIHSMEPKSPDTWCFTCQVTFCIPLDKHQSV